MFPSPHPSFVFSPADRWRPISWWANPCSKGIPKFHEIIEDQVVEGDKEVHRYVIRGTHEGEFMGIPATGKEVVVTGITLARIVDGKIAEEWTQADMLGLMQQLGLVPAN